LLNTVKGRSELDFLQSQPLISLTVNQAVKRAPWNVYFPSTGPPVARPLAPDREISQFRARVVFDTYPDTNLKPPAAVGSAGFLIWTSGKRPRPESWNFKNQVGVVFVQQRTI